MSFHRGLIPREGFHADVVGGLIKRTVLNPALVLPLVLLAKYTDQGRNLASQYARGFTGLKTVAVLGAIRWVNNFLGRRALNNGVSDKYDWSKEIVLLTGGSDGIGKQIALMFASKGVKVVVLDIQPLTYTARL